MSRRIAGHIRLIWVFYIVSWLIALAVPLCFELYDYHSGHHGSFGWTRLLVIYLGFLPFLLIFLFRHQQIGQQIDRQELQTASLQSELDYLKYQINPHFFMNTLNNIHALVDIDGELAKEAIIRLSRLMRYLLYESNQPTVPIQKELQFIQQYVELMKLRCDDSVSLSFQNDIDPHHQHLVVPPLLVISFIENAFKHGISHREPSFIEVSIKADDAYLHFHCRNSRFSHESNPQQQGGVGLDNIRKRLDLIYPGRYKLVIEPTDHEFLVDLTIPIFIP